MRISYYYASILRSIISISFIGEDDVSIWIESADSYVKPFFILFQLKIPIWADIKSV